MFDDDLALANDDFFLHFAIQIQIHPYNKPPRTIEAIFDDDFVSIGNDAVIVSSSPQITCKSKEVGDLKMDDEVIIKNKAYLVREIQPDSTGLTVFYCYESSTIRNS